VNRAVTDIFHGVSQFPLAHFNSLSLLSPQSMHDAMSRSGAQENTLLDIAKTNPRASNLVTTRDWALPPARRSSPPLSDLFPEYYEPIKPEQSSSILNPSGTTYLSSDFEHAQPASDGMLPEYLHSTRDELLARELQSRRELVSLREGFDQGSSAVPSSVSPMTTRLPPSIKFGARPTAASKHHCLISGHLFEHHRLSRLLSSVEINGLVPPSQQSTHKQEDLKVSCMICRARIKEHLWKCAIPVCLREVCGDCKSRLEQERASGAIVGWRGGS